MCVLGKPWRSFLHVLDACQGPSPRSRSDGGKKRGQQRRNVVFRTIWSKARLQSSIVRYTEPLFMPDTVWGPDLFGHGLGGKLVVFSKDNLDFKRKITAPELHAKGYHRRARLCKTEYHKITTIKSTRGHSGRGAEAVGLLAENRGVLSDTVTVWTSEIKE